MPVQRTVVRLRAHPDVARAVADPCRVHRAVIRALDGPDVGRELWAVPRSDRLVVQHTGCFDVGRLPPSWPIDARATAVDDVPPAGEPTRWSWIANAQRATHTPGQRGRRAAIQDSEQLLAWAQDRLERAGLAVDTMTLSDLRTVGGDHHSGGRVTLRRAHLAGTGQVVDADALRAAVHGGLGAGKAHGCGLLTVVAADRIREVA